ncbi:TPA: hypothetical protein DDW35_12410 [Candidatus Sumerlaeota bacterium]|jgi:DNA replication and repair protein RecF|nr:hypothetical protein [Candidatus Sumerlaeota bacterium]
MYLENIFIDQFRCLSHLETDLPPGRILIIGNNATGKTSLLEAVFYLVTGRSFRTRIDNDCVPWRSATGSCACVRATVRHAAGDSCRLAVTLGPGIKSVRIDDQPIDRLASLWGRLRAVVFTPDDLQLIKGGPAERRRYLDVALSQISPDYLFRLQRYNNALRQRNALLKRNDLSDRDLRANIAPWDTQLAEQAIPILMMRQDFLSGLEPRTARMYEKFLTEEIAETEKIRLSYNNSLRFELPEESGLDEPLQEARMRMVELLRESLEDDRRRGQTTIGPHRDDFQVFLSGKLARDFASQGQVRSAVLALRFAEAQEMEARTGEPPVALLDDIASELDPVRKERLLHLLRPEWQTFMTTTRREDFPPGSHFDAVLPLPLDNF